MLLLKLQFSQGLITCYQRWFERRDGRYKEENRICPCSVFYLMCCQKFLHPYSPANSLFSHRRVASGSVIITRIFSARLFYSLPDFFEFLLTKSIGFGIVAPVAAKKNRFWVSSYFWLASFGQFPATNLFFVW